MTKSLRIAFDAKRYFHNASGLGNYSRDIVRILKENFPESEYYLMDAEKGEPEIARRGRNSVLPKSFWRSRGIQKNLAHIQPNVFHGLSNEIPLGQFPSNSKVVVTIHDLIFKHFPQYYKATDRLIYDKKTKYACERADAVIAISPQTKDDIVRFYNIDPNKIYIHYQPCNTIFMSRGTDKKLARTKEKYGLHDEYFLYVSSFEPRKNHKALVKAFAKLPDENLVLAGFGGSTLKEISELVSDLKMDDRVRIVLKPGMEDLRNIYNLATSFVYPSVLEGFGIPVLEALTCGLPVFCSDQKNFKLMFEDAATYFNPTDINSIVQVLGESKIPLESNRQKVLNKFDEETIAKGIFGLYQNLQN
jgi:glycosyltransferase involved in cell wall biosynthesis